MPNVNHSNKEYLDSLVIGSGHSILAGYIPPSVPVKEFNEKFYQWSKKDPEALAQFGFWGGEIDYNTYYPNLPTDELKPKSDEFIEPMFRLLSETIVSKNYNPTDFSRGGVLKASMPLLLGQTVNCDHETNIGNAIGAVSQVVWQDAYKDGNFTIPAGINGILKIDGKANPRIARGILMEPPSIHSNSVTVQFKWDKSHPDMSDEDFYYKLGTYDKEGKMICRVVTEVVRYLETSLVSHGADSFAQKIGDNGKIINPTFAKRTWASYEEYRDDKSKQFFFNDWKSDFQSFNENDTQSCINENPEGNTQSKTSNMTLEEFIASMTGDKGIIKLGEGVQANAETFTSALKNVVSEYNQLKANHETLMAEKTALSEQVTNLNAEVANLKEMATVGKNHISALRETAVANYKKLKGDKVDETIVTMLNAETTGLVTLESLNNDYLAQLEEKFPMVCSKCGSHEVSRASSVKESEDTTSNDEKETDVYAEAYHQKLNPKK